MTGSRFAAGTHFARVAASIPQTIDAAQAAARTWDAIVIGAGPAGAFAALGLARAGISTLLVDRKAFPRNKVCGGCLNHHAVDLLEEAGLAGEIRALGARPISAIQLRYGHARANLAMPSGLAVTRMMLDAVLVRATISAGCAFLPETLAVVHAPVQGDTTRHADTSMHADATTHAEPRPHDDFHAVVNGSSRDDVRRVALQQRGDQNVTASARVVIVADGLGHASLRDCPSMRGVVEPDARVGVGAITDNACIDAVGGCVTMIVGRGGYVGITSVEDAGVNIAAALDVDFLKSQGSPAAAVRAILSSAGTPASSALDELDWQGTVPLTRRVFSPVAHRIFVVGDAAGYVEPFTGEGMAWAFSAARALVPLVARAVVEWDAGIERQWLATYDSIVRQNQRWCRVIARTLRYPSLAGVMVSALSLQPALARPFFARVAPDAAARSTGDS